MASAHGITVVARLGGELGCNHLFAHSVNTHVHTFHYFLKLSWTVSNEFQAGQICVFKSPDNGSDSAQGLVDNPFATVFIKSPRLFRNGSDQSPGRMKTERRNQELLVRFGIVRNGSSHAIDHDTRHDVEQLHQGSLVFGLDQFVFAIADAIALRGAAVLHVARVNPSDVREFDTSGWRGNISVYILRGN